MFFIQDNIITLLIALGTPNRGFMERAAFLSGLLFAHYRPFPLTNTGRPQYLSLSPL